MRAAALVCLILAVIFPLLLNGQTFTNNLIGIAFVTASVALCIAPVRRARSIREASWSVGVMAVVAVLLGVLLLVQLPAAFTFQAEFNRSMERIRQKRATPASAPSEATSDE
jgi:uncharacterized membrane protein HdeD (DUF308 family)